MPKINIVTVRGGWILPQIAKNWAKRIPECSLSYGPDKKADINFYVNYQVLDVIGYPKTKLDIGFFTHREPTKPFDKVAAFVDHCIGMSKYAYDLLPVDKRSLIKPIGPNTKVFKNKKLNIGVSAKNYSTGRKRLDILDRISKISGVNIRLTGGKLSEPELLEFYNGIDYLLVTSNVEGGPVPVLESLLLNKPVIAPDVGWCWDFPVVKYSSVDELETIISKLASPIISWEESSKEVYSILVECFNRMKQ